MKNIERIKKAYDINMMKNGFLTVTKKGEFPTKFVLPSKNCRLYFMFNEIFNKTTIGGLVKGRKVIKITALDLYKEVLDETKFNSCIEAFKVFKFEGNRAV